MFNTECDPEKESPFELCPKVEKIKAENINKEEIIKTLKCSHVIGINFSVWWYRRCIECNLEQTLNIMPHFIK